MAPKVHLIHYRRIGLDCVDVKFHVLTHGEEKAIRVIYTIEDEQLCKAKEVDDSFISVIKARCASDFHVWTVLGKYGTNM